MPREEAKNRGTFGDSVRSNHSDRRNCNGRVDAKSDPSEKEEEDVSRAYYLAGQALKNNRTFGFGKKNQTGLEVEVLLACIRHTQFDRALLFYYLRRSAVSQSAQSRL